MKTQVAMILTMLLLIGNLASLDLVKAEQSRIPHQDPSTLQTTLDTYSFLEQYTAIFALMSNQQYENATQQMEQVSHITAPTRLSYLIDRYNNLTQQLISVLNDLQKTLDTTSVLLDQNRLSDAEKALNQAAILVAKAQILLNDLKEATLTVRERLGIFSANSGNRVKEAYSQLQNMLEKLNELIERYHTLMQKAQQRVEGIKEQNYKETTLSLSLSSTKCFVGSTVSASGILTSKQAPLNNREIKLFIDNSQVATIKTDNNGQYTATLKVPYTYVDSVSVNALYSPEGNDKNKYLAGSSPIIKLQILFYKTNLEISVPDVAYLGLPLTISGIITSIDRATLNDRQVNIFFDNKHETHAKSNQNGTFTAEFVVDAQLKLGKHVLKVTVDPQGNFAPITIQKTVTIQQKPTYLQTNTPSFMLLPAKLEVTGKVFSSDNPLKDATVQIDYENITSTTKTLLDGSFNLTIEIPLNSTLAGNQELTIKAVPTEPWQATTKITKSVFTLNSVSTSVALASTFSIFAMAYVKLAKNRKTHQTIINEKAITTILQTFEKNRTETRKIEIISDQKGAREKILKAYLEVLSIVQAYTDKPFLASMTLREYAQAVESTIENIATEFRELTNLAEKSLYSPHEPQPQEIETAETIAITTRRNLAATK